MQIVSILTINYQLHKNSAQRLTHTTLHVTKDHFFINIYYSIWALCYITRGHLLLHCPRHSYIGQEVGQLPP